MTKNKKCIIHIKRCLALFLIVVISANFFAVSAGAAESTDILRQSIYEATRLLEDAIKTSMNDAEKSVKQQIVEKNYDYYTTMETFFRCDNPYLDADYLELIAAYIVVRGNNGNPDKSFFYGLPYIRANITTAYSWEYLPAEVDRYEQDKDGNYYPNGKTYITEPQKITTFERTEDGKYRPSGVRDISPELVFTKYGDVSLTGLSAEDILIFYGLNPDVYLKDVQKKKEEFDLIINGEGLKQSMFLDSQKTDLLDEETISYIESLLKDGDLDLSRKCLIDAAVSLVGKVPYEWGGKAAGAGYDTGWWTIDNTGRQKGLDCSGFVQWAFMTAGFDQTLYDQMISTDMILKYTETISESQLEPGDMGLINNGQTINHVGIYLGSGLWVHCSSTDNTVVVKKTSMFKIFKRMPDGDRKSINEQISETGSSEESAVYLIPEYQTECRFTDYEIYLTAQLVYNEAVGEGINGWAAVAEVVLNRINSERFPDSVEEVIYQEGQFSDSEKISLREPPEEMVKTVKEVFAGNMKVFNNKDVLFFKNAGGSTEDWGNHPYFHTVNSHQFYKY